MLPAEMASTPERLERFRREAKALAALDHPGIVTVHSVEEADGVHFLTMQLVEGQPLDRLIPEVGLPLDAPPRRSPLRSPRPSPPPTRRASSTATSSRPTSW